MYGTCQHAPRSAVLDQAAVTGDGQQNTNQNIGALAPGQMSPPDLCLGSVCPVSSEPHASSEGAVGQPFSASAAIAIPGEVYGLPLEALDLSLRLFHLLQRTGILTVGQIFEMDLESFHQLSIGDKSLQELVHRIQTLNLLDPVHQRQRDESLEAAPTGRHDNRQRPGRGKLREAASLQPQPQYLRISSSALFGFCYKVPVAQLPLALRLELPRWARCGIEQAEENTTSREELPRRTRYCYLQPFARGETGDLTAWKSEPGSSAPSHYRVAAAPDTLREARFIEVGEQEAHALVRGLVNAAAPSPLIRVALACSLTAEMRAMIAPRVSFPDTCAVPDNAAQRRVSLARGNQVAIPRQIAEMRIEDLPLSVQTLTCLLEADVTTVGTLLELEEERLVEFLDRESLWELYTAVFATGVLPTPTGILPAEQPDEVVSPLPVFETIYYYPTGTTYDDEQLGRLYLVHAALFVDRLDGSRNGPVEALWLTRAQIGQSLIWERELERLDSLELRVRVTTHAIARGAVIPGVVPAHEAARECYRREHELEERYNLVPFRHELFVSNEDLDTEDARRHSPTRTVLHLLDRYIRRPELQPVGERLPRRILEEMDYWIREDRRRQFEELLSPASPTIVMHEVYVRRKRRVRDKTGKLVIQEVTELVGYSLTIGVLASTPVPGDLIIEPRRGKPQFTAPGRPIEPIRTPNYMPIQIAA